MRFRFILSVFIVVLMALAVGAAPAWADDVAALKAKLTALDKTRLGGAKEKALLGEIGGLAKGLKARTIPEAFHRRMARGRAHVKSAKNRADFRSAAKEFRAAVMAAPWVASAHYNLGIVRDKAGLYNGAIRSMRTYLALKPGASDARRVRNLTYEIEVRREKAGQARRIAKTRKAKRAGKTRKAAKKSAGWRGFAGEWCSHACKWVYRATISGNVIELKFKGRTGEGHGLVDHYETFRATISPDGKLKGNFKSGDIMLAHPNCRGRDFSDQYPLTGEIRNGNVMDSKGSMIIGGVIIFRYKSWPGHAYNYNRCILERAAKSYGGKTLTWSSRVIMFRRAR